MSAPLDDIALQLAPSLRDKFDFSVPAQFDEWAALSYQAAGAFKAKADGLASARAEAEAKIAAAADKAMNPPTKEDAK